MEHKQVGTTSTTTRSLLLADLEEMIESRGQSRALWWAEVVLKIMLVPRVRAVCLFRLSQYFARRRMMPIALFVQGRALRGSGAEISPSAQIGPGLILMHSVGVVIGPEVRIGAGARIYHGVTVGDGRLQGQPTIGDHVTLGAGARVLGGVTLGDRVYVGAGARVSEDLPDDAVALAPSGSFKLRRLGVDPRLDALASATVEGPAGVSAGRPALP